MRGGPFSIACHLRSGPGSTFDPSAFHAYVPRTVVHRIAKLTASIVLKPLLRAAISALDGQRYRLVSRCDRPMTRIGRFVGYPEILRAARCDRRMGTAASERKARTLPGPVLPRELELTLQAVDDNEMDDASGLARTKRRSCSMRRMPCVGSPLVRYRRIDPMHGPDPFRSSYSFTSLKSSCKSGERMISIRRFFALSVWLTGMYSPLPAAVTRTGSIALLS